MNRLSIALFLVATSFFITSCSNQLVQSPSSSPALGSDGIINALADLAEIEHWIEERKQSRDKAIRPGSAATPGTPSGTK